MTSERKAVKNSSSTVNFRDRTDFGRISSWSHEPDYIRIYKTREQTSQQQRICKCHGKSLPLKWKETQTQMKTQDILNKAKGEFKDFIVYEVRNIYDTLHKGVNPNFSNDEEWELKEEELFYHPSIKVKYEDEVRRIKQINVTLDDNLFIKAEGDDTEIEWSDIEVQSLYYIALMCEKTYYNLIGIKAEE